MDFKEWKKQQRKTNKEIAAHTGVSVVTVSRWLNKIKTPNLQSFKKISDLTSGEVTAEDFIKAETPCER